MVFTPNPSKVERRKRDCLQAPEVDAGPHREPWERTHTSAPTTVYAGRTDSEAEAPTLWPPDVKSQLTVKELDAWTD